MTSKRKIYLLGLLTLFAFPVPTFIYRIIWQSESFYEIMELDLFWNLNTLNGLAFGIIYAQLAVFLLKKPVFKNELNKQQQMIRQLNLNKFDAVFLSLCAGIGEELLFRAGIQLWLGPVITTIVFIAVHGYYHPKNWRMSLYGLLLTPFILVLSFGYDYWSLWFAAAAHFAYDWVLFNESSHENNTR